MQFLTQVNRPRLIWMTSFFLALVMVFPVHAAMQVKQLRATSETDSTRLVIETSAIPSYRKFHLSSPSRMVVDLRATDTQLPASLLNYQDSLIKGIRAGRRNDGVRLVFDLNGDYPSKAFVLEAADGRPARLVIDVAGKPAVVQAAPATPKPSPTETSATAPVAAKPKAENSNAPTAQVSAGTRDIIVAIDAGHGGKDPGALAKGGIREKDVVLDVARVLKREFDRMPGFTGVLTRAGDTFIPLAKRPQIARDANADFFVSLHADSFPKDSRVYGGGVYALSLRGATSETARWLARRENAVDLSHGVDLGDVDDDIRKVLLNMSMDSAIRISKQAGSKVIKEMGAVQRMHRRRLEQANFMVLRSPDIPSLLVELGFLSNTKDVKRLTTPSEQQKVARAVARGIASYFEASPPANTLVSNQKAEQGVVYTVVRGDTLSAIAQRNGVSMASIRKANQLTGDAIRIGQRLSIPRS